MQQPGKHELDKLIGRAVAKLQDKAEKQEVKHLVTKFLMKRHQLEQKQAKALVKEALKPGRGWQVLDGILVKEGRPADSIAAPSEQAADTSLQQQHLQQKQQQQQQQRAKVDTEGQLQAPAAKASKPHALASAGAAARAAGASRPPAGGAAEGLATSSGVGSQGSLQPASTAAGPPPPAAPPAATTPGAAGGGKAASKAAAGGAAAGRSQTQAALAAAMLAAPAGSTAGRSLAGGQRQQQQQGRKRKAQEPAGSLQASAGTAFRPAVFSLQAGIPQGGGSSDGEDAPMGSGGKKRRRRQRDVVPDAETWRGDYNRSDVTHGRFTDAEKETLKAAIVAYEEEHGMDTTDHTWLLAATANKRKGAVSQIAAALPSRNRKAVWSCLVRMLSPDNYRGAWTQEEDNQLKELVDEKGRRWKEIGGLLGRLPESCRDRWRIRWQVPDVNIGPWSPEEVSKLQQVVERALALKNAGGGPRTIKSVPNRDMAREKSMFELDGVNWEWVATEMGTRNYKQCLQKWYDELTPAPTELWDPSEDKLLVLALWRTQATEPHQVDWGSLVQGRSAAVAYRRWRFLMTTIPANIRWDLAAAVECAMAEFAAGRKELKAAKKAEKQQQEEEEGEEEGVPEEAS